VPKTSSSQEEDYRVLTEECGLVDRSELGKLALAGSEAKTMLQGQVTNDVEALEAGRGCYAAFLTQKGKMLGDLRVLDLGDELLLVCERIALQQLFNLLRRARVGYDAELHKRTLERGLISLVGPGARRVASSGDLDTAEHANRAARIGEAAVVLVATDVGVDVLCDAEDTERVAQTLAERGATPVAEAGVELLRVERGRPRYGVELDDSVIPQEAGLNERAVSFTKGCYVGQETVARLFYRGKPNRHLRALRLSEPVEPGTPLRLDGRELGRVASAVVSPRFGPIGLALVRREAEPGAVLTAGDSGATAEVVVPPIGPADPSAA
jgi:tRNA-modifying protein YgfZ